MISKTLAVYTPSTGVYTNPSNDIAFACNLSALADLAEKLLDGGHLAEISTHLVRIQSCRESEYETRCYCGKAKEMQPVLKFLYYLLAMMAPSYDVTHIGELGFVRIRATQSDTLSLDEDEDPDAEHKTATETILRLLPHFDFPTKIKFAVMFACGLWDESDLLCGLDHNVQEIVNAV